jgi:5,10-methylenetetrahydromethanopterin reductase
MLNADPFVAMAAASMQTHAINLGTGVLVPSNRIAPVTATCLASLNQLAPGRIHFGVATGFTARRVIGLGAVKRDDMAAYIRQVQGLLRRKAVEANVEGQTRKIRFLNPELDLINTQDDIPLYISAFGPAAPVPKAPRILLTRMVLPPEADVAAALRPHAQARP